MPAVNFDQHWAELASLDVSQPLSQDLYGFVLFLLGSKVSPSGSTVIQQDGHDFQPNLGTFFRLDRDANLDVGNGCGWEDQHFVQVEAG